MLFKNKSLVAVLSCAMMFAAAPLLPADLSIMNSAYAKGSGGGGGGGNGGGNGGGHSGSDHGSSDSNGRGNGLSSDHAGKAVRDRGESGNRYGSDSGHGSTTSGIAHSKDTRGVAKATAISTSTPGEHNAKGLSNAGTSTSKKSH
ncbi:hypothetical protein BFW88_18055 [Pseudomonas fluorescens]|nr:hypothetical protein BFW88_18055 [Pseudomonas fluorescens]OPB07972.1 hypothetical protein BFW92_17995 [Pseudomonas fluorescens]